MTNTETAFATATRMIREARRTGAARLDLDTPETRALYRLPDGIGDLTELRTLDLRNIQITDLSPLTALTSLSRLYLSNTRVTDLSPIIALTDLSKLSLSNTQITDLSPLTALTGLSELSISNSQITDLSPLTALTGLSGLYLNNTQVTDLSPLTALTGLSTLSLEHTQIADLSPLAALTGLSLLYLSNTQVADLRPLRSLTLLVEEPQFSGLTFTNTPATHIDPRIAEIASFGNHSTRARELFAYLEDWVPPVPADSPYAPAYDVPDTGPITSRADPPSGGDEDQEELRQDLIRKASILIEAIGSSNQLSILSGAAQHYQTQVSKDLPRMRLNLLYSAANSLRVALEAHEKAKENALFNDELPPVAAAALTDLVQTHALFFMGFPNGAEVHQTMLSGLTGTRNRAAVEAAEPLVTALEGKDTVLAPEDQQALQDDLAGAKGEGPSAEIAERRLVGGIRNFIAAVGRKAYSAAKGGTALLLAHDIPAWILGNQTAIGAVLKSATIAAEPWFAWLMQQLLVLLG